MDRMSDTSWKHYRMDAHWTERDRAIITAELDRARQTETDLAETIEALSDALEAVWRRGLASPGVYTQCEAALRKVGRLP